MGDVSPENFGPVAISGPKPCAKVRSTDRYTYLPRYTVDLVYIDKVSGGVFLWYDVKDEVSFSGNQVIFVRFTFLVVTNHGR